MTVAVRVEGERESCLCKETVMGACLHELVSPGPLHVRSHFWDIASNPSTSVAECLDRYLIRSGYDKNGYFHGLSTQPCSSVQEATCSSGANPPKYRRGTCTCTEGGHASLSSVPSSTHCSTSRRLSIMAPPLSRDLRMA